MRLSLLLLLDDWRDETIEEVTMLLMMMKEEGVSSPTEKLDREGSFYVTSQQEDGCMWGKELLIG